MHAYINSWDDQGSCTIHVTYEPMIGELRFKCNGIEVRGSIPNVRGRALHPVVYSSGFGMTFKVYDLAKHVRYVTYLYVM